MTRSELITLLQQAEWVVRPWGTVGPGNDEFLIVRTGGVVSGRRVHEVWLVAGAIYAGSDPDAGLQEAAERLWGFLREHLADVEVAPGPLYEPNRGASHLTMVCTGTESIGGLEK